MSRTSSSHFFVAGLALLAVTVFVTAWLVAKTPGATIGDRVIRWPAAAATDENIAYTLPEGRSAADVGRDLEALGVIDSATRFKLLVSLMGLQDRLSAADYRLGRGSPVAAVIDAITVKPQAPTLRVTFPEGIRIEEMAVVAERAGFGTADDFLAAAAAAPLPPGLAEGLPGALSGFQLQGYLFPDTYFMPRGSSAADLVRYMLRTFDERFSPELRTAAAAAGLTVHQAVTLASIIEREAVLATERPLISGVFHNRLAQNDLLGADPTVQFVAALDPESVAKHGWWKKELTIDDLETPSPYNTRIVPGLPPGPITNPGLDAIRAAVLPEKTKAYYFVANAKEGDGSHVFAETFEEHLRNQARFGQ